MTGNGYPGGDPMCVDMNRGYFGKVESTLARPLLCFNRVFLLLSLFTEGAAALLLQYSAEFLNHLSLYGGLDLISLPKLGLNRLIAE